MISVFNYVTRPHDTPPHVCFLSDNFTLSSNDWSTATYNFGSDNKPDQPLHFQFPKCEVKIVKRAFQAH